MDREVHGRAVSIGKASRERPCRLQTLFRAQLMRQRDLELPRDTGIGTLFCGLGRVPQGRSITRPFRR